MSTNTCRELIEMMHDKCYIKKLALVDVGLDDTCFDIFCLYVEYSSYIQEIDISYAGVSPPKIL